jgi:heme-degrading monooxygenase HmoA
VPDPFAYIWAYRVSPDRLGEFQALYGPAGAWVELFGLAAGYVDTELLRDRSEPSRFITIDRWESEEAFVHFRASFSEEFDRLDGLGRMLTVEETPLGEFTSISGRSRESHAPDPFDGDT